jgi:hypothetical protein
MKYRDCIVAWTPSYGPYDHLETVGGSPSARTTQLYYRRSDEVSLDEVERILI